MPWARCTGPPRSNSQYQRANAITLVAQMAAPEASSGPGCLVAGLMVRISRMSSTADAALAPVITRISTMLTQRTKTPRRSIRTGLAMARPSSTPTSRTGSSNVGSGRIDS